MELIYTKCLGTMPDIIITAVITVTSSALFREESKGLTLNTDLPVSGSLRSTSFFLPTSFFSSNISNTKYPLKHPNHHPDLFSLTFSP